MWITCSSFPCGRTLPGESQEAEWAPRKGADAARPKDSARPLLPCSARRSNAPSWERIPNIGKDDRAGTKNILPQFAQEVKQ